MQISALQHHLEKIHVFTVVVRTGSFRQAAQVLRISQPSLSRTVKILEEALEQPLLQRTHQGVHVTKAGQLLLEFSSRITTDIEKLEHQLKSRRTGLSAKIIVGSHESLAIRIWPSFVGSMAKKHPGLSMSLKTGCNNTILTQMLTNSQLDLAVIVRTISHPDIINKKLYSDSFGLYISPELYREKFAAASKIPLKKVQQAPFVIVPTATYDEGNTIDQLAWKTGLLGRQMTYELDSFEAAKEFIAQGVGIGLLPKWIAAPSVEGNSIREISIRDFPNAPLGPHTIYAAYRRADRLDPVMQAVLKQTEVFFRS